MSGIVYFQKKNIANMKISSIQVVQRIKEFSCTKNRPTLLAHAMEVVVFLSCTCTLGALYRNNQRKKDHISWRRTRPRMPRTALTVTCSVVSDVHRAFPYLSSSLCWSSPSSQIKTNKHGSEWPSRDGEAVQPNLSAHPSWMADTTNKLLRHEETRKGIGIHFHSSLLVSV